MFIGRGNLKIMKIFVLGNLELQDLDYRGGQAWSWLLHVNRSQVSTENQILSECDSNKLHDIIVFGCIGITTKIKLK